MRHVLVCAALLLSWGFFAGLQTGWAEDPAQPTTITIVPGEDSFKGKGTDEQFPMEITMVWPGNEIPLSALGSGVRKKFIFKGYECIAYAEKSADLNPDPGVAFIKGNFPKLVRMHFLRNVGGGKIRGFFRGGLKKVLGDNDWDPALTEDFETFLGFIGDKGIKDGESIQLLWIPGRGLFTKVGEEMFPPISAPLFASSLWAMWLGDNPISKGLKKDMLRFVVDVP